MQILSKNHEKIAKFGKKKIVKKKSRILAKNRRKYANFTKTIIEKHKESQKKF